MVAASGSELHDSLDMNVQGFDLSSTTLSGIRLPRFLTNSLAATLLERVGEECHTFLPIKGPQGIERGPEPFRC
jgi:hypothetical protein